MSRARLGRGRRREDTAARASSQRSPVKRGARVEAAPATKPPVRRSRRCSRSRKARDHRRAFGAGGPPWPSPGGRRGGEVPPLPQRRNAPCSMRKGGSGRCADRRPAMGRPRDARGARVPRSQPRRRSVLILAAMRSDDIERDATRLEPIASLAARRRGRSIFNRSRRRYGTPVRPILLPQEEALPAGEFERICVPSPRASRISPRNSSTALSRGHTAVNRRRR